MAKAQGTVFTTSGARTALEELNQDYYGRKTWGTMYGNVGQMADIYTSQLTTDYEKAINDAYIAAIKNENAITSSNLGQGYKALALQENQQALNDAFAQYRQSYLSGSNEIKKELASDVNAISSELESEASKLSRYGNAHFDYVNWLYEKDPELFEKDLNWAQFMTGTGADRRLKTYGELTGGMFDTTTGELNRAGLDFLQLVDSYSGQGGPHTFGDYLAETDYDLFEWAQGSNEYDYGKKTSDMFRELTGNRTVEDYKANLVNLSNPDVQTAIKETAESLRVSYNTVMSTYDGKSKNKTETKATMEALVPAIEDLDSFIVSSGLLDVTDVKHKYDKFMENYQTYVNVINDPGSRKGSNRQNRAWAVSNLIADYEELYSLVMRSAGLNDAEATLGETKRRKDRVLRQENRANKKAESEKKAEQNAQLFKQIYGKYNIQPYKNIFDVASNMNLFGNLFKRK